MQYVYFVLTFVRLLLLPILLFQIRILDLDGESTEQCFDGSVVCLGVSQLWFVRRCGAMMSCDEICSCFSRALSRGASLFSRLSSLKNDWL